MKLIDVLSKITTLTLKTFKTLKTLKTLKIPPARQPASWAARSFQKQLAAQLSGSQPKGISTQPLNQPAMQLSSQSSVLNASRLHVRLAACFHSCLLGSWMAAWLAERIFRVFKVFNVFNVFKVFKLKVVIMLRTSVNFMTFRLSRQSKKSQMSLLKSCFLLCQDESNFMKLKDVRSKIAIFS